MAEQVQAGVPPGRVTRGLADLVERVHEGERGAFAVGPQIEPEGLVVPPSELEHRRRVVPDHLTVDGRTLPVAEHEAQRGTGRPLPFDVGREPGREVLWLGQGAPDLLRRVRKRPREAQMPATIPLLELPIHFNHLLGTGFPAWPRDAVRAGRAATPRARGTAPATRRSRAGAPFGPGRCGAARPIGPPPGRPPAGRAGAWIPQAG